MFDDIDDFFIFLYIIPILIIGAIIFAAIFVGRIVRNRNRSNNDSSLNLALSKEDAASEFFFLLSLLFLGVTILSFNRELFNSYLVWHSVIFTTSAVGIIGAYYFKVLYAFTFSLLGIVIWWMVKTGEWMNLPDKTGEWMNLPHKSDIKMVSLIVLFAFIAILFYLLGHAHNQKKLVWKRFSMVYSVFGIFFITAFLFIFSTQFGLKLFAEGTKGVLIFASWQIVVSLLLLLVSIIAAVIYNFIRKLIFKWEILAVLIFTLLFAVIIFLPEQIMFVGYSRRSAELSALGILWAIIFNVLLFGEIIGLILAGYGRKEKWLINLGIFFLFIFILVKYFDWFFDFLDKSVFFIGAGILLFAVGWLMERGRRYMLSEMKNKNGEASAELILK